MSKLVIELIRKAGDTFDVAIRKDGKRKKYAADAPEINEYRAAIDELASMMQSSNAGKVSFTVS